MIAGASPDAALLALVRAIAVGDTASAGQLLAESPALAHMCFHKGTTRQETKAYYLDAIGHCVYAGDTALHIAAAAYREDMVRTLLSKGSNVRAKNHRGAEPLHSAAVGSPGSPTWNPRAQITTIRCLIEAGADPNAANAEGATALHRAVRTRCAAAVKALLDGGADALRQNKSGSTPMRLATLNTGRGGAGSAEARQQQAEIVRLLERYAAPLG